MRQRTILSFLLFSLSFLSLSLSVTATATEYLIWLKTSQKVTEGSQGREILRNHVISMEKLVPSFQLRHVYNNLVLYGYLVYSASIDEMYWDEFIQLADIKLAEEIQQYKVAETSKFPIEFVPFAPPSISGATVSREGYSLCTVPNDYLKTLKDDNTTLHEMDVYVLDTGIDSTHKSLVGRVKSGIDVIDSPPLRSDPHGHGTEVAGLIGGVGYGVNPNVTLVDIRVVNAQGYARTDDIIAGLDYALGDHMIRREADALKSIINLSLTGPQSKLLEFALYIISQSLLVVVANGDENSFSCWKSPSSSDFVLSVGGTSFPTDTALLGSNFGDCVHIMAPGERLLTSTTSARGVFSPTRYVTGSSYAAAIVSGIATRLIGFIESNQTVKDSLFLSFSAPDVSKFLRTVLTSTKYTFMNQTDTVHLSLSLTCDFSYYSNMDYIFTKELKLVPKKKTITALNRAKRTLLEMQQKQRAAKFRDDNMEI